MQYKKFHILDVVIEDETQRNGRDVTVSVDTHEMVTLELGNTTTIRTDEAGVDDLREALHRALVKLEEIRYEKTREQAAEDAWQTSPEAEMIQAGIDAREKLKQLRRSEQQLHDVWNPNDPSNW